MKLYNTLTRKIEEFKPINDKKVTFYHCGPTVYWIQHIGNLRGMTMADLIHRTLIYLGFEVTFVRNYTDVGHFTSDQDTGEDKMEKGAKREGLTPREIADKYIKIFENDIKAINILEPSFKPRASDYIAPIVEMIQTLLNKGFAYITDQAVVYDVTKFPNYNQLNHQKMEELVKGLGKGDVENPGKRHFADFNLWVFKKGRHQNALQTWPSPWGEGFPGWHIECSVMSKKLLGETIDIHMGGIEHISIHNTNEIAQSEAVSGKKFVNYWLHNEWLVVNEKKMAKSTGTGFTLQQIIDKGFDPLALRYLFFNAHYRSKQNFTWQTLESAQNSLNNLRQKIVDLKTSENLRSNIKDLESNFKYQFTEFISSDFQIPQALALLWDVLKSDLNDKEKLALAIDFDRVFGLKLSEISEEKVPEEIIKLAEERKTARKNKDFTKADELRKEINKKGYQVEDKGKDFKISEI